MAISIFTFTPTCRKQNWWDSLKQPGALFIYLFWELLGWHAKQDYIGREAYWRVWQDQELSNISCETEVAICSDIYLEAKVWLPRYFSQTKIFNTIAQCKMAKENICAKET